MSKKATPLSRDGLKVSPRVLALADAIATDLKIGNAGVAEVPTDLFEKTLPEGLTLEIVKKVDNARSEFVAGTALALGEAAAIEFQNDKSLQSVSLGVGLNKDRLTIQTDRLREFPNRMGGEGAAPVRRALFTNVSYKMASAGNRGDYKKVRDHLGAKGGSIFT